MKWQWIFQTSGKEPKKTAWLASGCDGSVFVLFKAGLCLVWIKQHCQAVFTVCLNHPAERSQSFDLALGLLHRFQCGVSFVLDLVRVSGWWPSHPSYDWQIISADN